MTQRTSDLVELKPERERRRRSSDCVRNLMSPSQLEAHRCAMPSAAVAPFMEGKGISPVGVTC